MDIIGKVDFDRFTVLKYCYGGPFRGSPLNRGTWKSLRAQSQHFMEQRSPRTWLCGGTRTAPGVGCGGASRCWGGGGASLIPGVSRTQAHAFHSSRRVAGAPPSRALPGGVNYTRPRSSSREQLCLCKTEAPALHPPRCKGGGQGRGTRSVCLADWPRAAVIYRVRHLLSGRW